MGVKKCLVLFYQHRYVCLCVYLYIQLFVCVLYLFIYFFLSIFICSFIMCLSIYLVICLCLFCILYFSYHHLFVYLSMYLCLFIFLLIRFVYFIYLLLEPFLLNQNRCDDEIKRKTHPHACSCLQPEAKTKFSRLLGTNIILSWREVKNFLTCSHAVFENIFCSLKVREEIDREDLLASQHSWAEVQVFHCVSRCMM